ncbi:hypothetical protein LPJ61_006956, partial [Coemansia biformis]
MYPWIKAFIAFVADSLPGTLRRISELGSCQPHVNLRRVIAYELADAVANGSDDRRQPGAALDKDTSQTVRSSDNARSYYRDAAAVIEVKRFPYQQRDAYKDLFVYMRNIYVNQHNRRYAWGLTICGTHVRACLFGHDKVIASDAMDVSTVDGRHRFVSLLVNWALCESAQLGYDPTI